jgi:hypothetical protein
MAALTVKIGTIIISNKLRKAPLDLETNVRPPSPTEIGDSSNWTANSPLEKFWDSIGISQIPVEGLEHSLFICVYILAILNFVFFFYVISNYVFRHWLYPKIKPKIKSKVLLKIIAFNEKISMSFFNYSFFMLLFNNFFTVPTGTFLLFFSNLLNSP